MAQECLHMFFFTFSCHLARLFDTACFDTHSYDDALLHSERKRVRPQCQGRASNKARAEENTAIAMRDNITLVYMLDIIAGQGRWLSKTLIVSLMRISDVRIREDSAREAAHTRRLLC